ncbi:MAG: hypothetical protein F4W89_11680 [Acidobacteria bacterium]|nr:hypothetical protein [Acidobacteriota bacterium]
MTAAPSARRPDYVRRHLRFGFWALVLFLTLGATLEALHGFKVGFYLDVSNETRRLMWTLAHAHGALLSLINVVAGVTLRAVPELAEDHRRTGLASTMLMAATILLPAGFFADGVTFYSGDPGIGIALVPPGAACLLIAVVQLARGSGEVRR